MNLVAFVHNMPNYATMRTDRSLFLAIELIGIAVAFVGGIRTS